MNENTEIMEEVNETEEVCDEVLDGEVVETEANGGGTTNLGVIAVIAGVSAIAGTVLWNKAIKPGAKFVYHKAKDAIVGFMAKREAKKLEDGKDQVVNETKEEEIDSEEGQGS